MFYPSRLLLASLALTCGRACAAEQGEVGTSSRGSVTINASVASRSLVSGVSDVASTSTQSVCLWSNSATRGYGLLASGDGPGGALVVDAVPYDVRWDGAPLAAGSAREGLTATAAQPGCGKVTGGRANLNVSFLSPVTRHNGTLTLLVIPE